MKAVLHTCVSAALVLATGASQAQVVLTGQVSSERSAFEDVFAATNRFHHGQRLQIMVSGQIDANHRYWQDRQCSWFGLRCRYVNREASNLMGPDRLPALLLLEPPDALEEPAHTYQSAWLGTPGVSHLTASLNGQYDVTLKVKDAEKSLSAFLAATQLRAVVADKDDQAVPINRNQCHNRPPVCSSGVYTVTITVDNKQRLASLKEILKVARNASEVVDIKSRDPLFVRDQEVRPSIADVLFKHTMEFHAKGGSEARRDHLKILAFATEMDPTRADILTEMAQTYIDLGEFASATATIKVGLEAAEQAYANEAPPHSAKSVTELSRLVGLRASIWVQERASIVGTDLMVAVGLYRKAAGYCLENAASASPADKKVLYSCGKDRLLDAGRTVAMLRTRDNLILAESLLTQAQEAARRAVDAN